VPLVSSVPHARPPHRRWRPLRNAAAALVVFAAATSAVGMAARPASAALSSGWNIVTAPGAPSGVNDVLLGSTCANALSCWSVGATLPNNGDPTPLVESWNGSAWTVAMVSLPSQFNGGVLLGVTCANGSGCWAVGAGTVDGANPSGVLAYRWTGTSWSSVPIPTPEGAVGAILEGVACVSASECWATGFTTDDTGAALRSLVERWNGSSWSIVLAGPSGQAYDQLNGVTCSSASDCWAVGNAGPTQQNPNFLPIFPAAAGDQGFIEQWDGNSWSTVPSYSAPGPDGGYLSSVTCVTTTDCWASGATTDSSGTAAATLMERWDGSSWSVVPTPVPPGSSGSILGGVTCLDAQRCWAAGSQGPFGGGGGSNFQPNSFIESWNGTSWSIEPTPNVTALSFLDSITCLRGTGCWAIGAALVNVSGSQGGFGPFIEQLVLPATSSNQGLVMTARDGGIFTFGDAGFYGSMGGKPLNEPVVGIAATPDRGGYWEVAADGGIFTFGDAGFYGSMGGKPLNEPVVGIAATPDGGGYWEVAADGGIFTFGDAGFYGSMGGKPLNEPVTGIATTPDGVGYWLIGADGGVFTFGNAGYFGSVPGQRITSPVPVVGISSAPDGQGYWLVSSSGSVYAYGDAAFLGSLAGTPLSAPVSGVAST